MPFSDPKTVINHFNLTEGMTVADFGAGSGAYALAMARRVGATGRVYAIDVQKELLARLAREADLEVRLPKGSLASRIINVEVIWGDLERAGGSTLADQSVDFVLVANLLFQVSAKYTLALEAKRILKPDGRLAVIDWQESFGGLGPPAPQVTRPEEAKKIMVQAGFLFLKDFPAGDHHYGLMFVLSS
ncbi:MAG: methyltransferase domain-containing protein [Candidatus Vogelbacteria bacterium]|nr:methyltransferase domain-containing protein [Candidatus Vogelbacteria bacterium]